MHENPYESPSEAGAQVSPSEAVIQADPDSWKYVKRLTLALFIVLPMNCLSFVWIILAVESLHSESHLTLSRSAFLLTGFLALAVVIALPVAVLARFVNK
jgi:hypothetical protein